MNYTKEAFKIPQNDFEMHVVLHITRIA